MQREYNKKMFATSQPGMLQVLNSKESSPHSNSQHAYSSLQQLQQANNSLVAQFALAASNAAKQNLYLNPPLFEQLLKNQYMNTPDESQMEQGNGDSDDNSSAKIATAEVAGEEKLNRVQARLARNRTTARLRRERKKQQAENLTSLVTELRVELEALERYVGSMPLEKQEEVKKNMESLGDPPVACLFCDQDFKTEQDRDNHHQSDHAADLKARQAFQKVFNEDQKKQAESTAVPNNKLTQEERRKRRLERNAASARLCRQRKKQYIENLRRQVPVLRHRVLGLRAFLPKETTERIQKDLKELIAKKERTSGFNFKAIPDIKEGKQTANYSGPENSKKVSIPRLSGWDNSFRRNTSAGYESGSSDSTLGSVKVHPNNTVRSPKRRRGSESTDVASASPPLAGVTMPLTAMPSFALPPMALPYGLNMNEQNMAQSDIYSAALALSNLGPISQKQT